MNSEIYMFLVGVFRVLLWELFAFVGFGVHPFFDGGFVYDGGFIYCE